MSLLIGPVTMDGVTPLAPGDVFGDFRIEAIAGRGGMGVVYRAVQLDLGRPVALKLIAADRAADPAFRERFQRESRLAALIDHPNVVPVHGAGEADGQLYLVMRYVPGTDLHRLLKHEGPLPPMRAAEVVVQVAAALDAAHAAGLVHRDVKPANVLIAGDDHAYLGDFGLTRLLSSEEQLTETGQWLGTTDFSSPEQLQGAAGRRARGHLLARLRPARGAVRQAAVPARDRCRRRCSPTSRTRSRGRRSRARRPASTA